MTGVTHEEMLDGAPVTITDATVSGFNDGAGFDVQRAEWGAKPELGEEPERYIRCERESEWADIRCRQPAEEFLHLYAGLRAGQ